MVVLVHLRKPPSQQWFDTSCCHLPKKHDHHASHSHLTLKPLHLPNKLKKSVISLFRSYTTDSFFVQSCFSIKVTSVSSVVNRQSHATLLAFPLPLPHSHFFLITSVVVVVVAAAAVFFATDAVHQHYHQNVTNEN